MKTRRSISKTGSDGLQPDIDRINGHKSYTAMESKAMNETLLKEKELRLNFEKNKFLMVKDRDPIRGEYTYRLTIPLMSPENAGKTEIDFTTSTRIKRLPDITPKVGENKCGPDGLVRVSRDGSISFLNSLHNRKNIVLERLKEAEAIANQRKELFNRSLANNRAGEVDVS